MALQELHTEMEAKAGTFQAFEAFGQQLIKSDHYASPEIQEKLDTLAKEREDLEVWVTNAFVNLKFVVSIWKEDLFFNGVESCFMVIIM